MARSIILALDGSQNSEEALLWYRNQLLKESDLVHLVTVTQPLHCPLAMSPLGAEPVVIMNYQEWQSCLKKNIQKAEALLLRAKAALEEAGVTCKMHLRHNSGNAGAEICQLANGLDAQCIIMGSRGLGMIRRTLIGSTSDYVLHHAACPVLIVKHPRNN